MKASEHTKDMKRILEYHREQSRKRAREEDQNQTRYVNADKTKWTTKVKEKSIKSVEKVHKGKIGKSQ